MKYSQHNHMENLSPYSDLTSLILSHLNAFEVNLDIPNDKSMKMWLLDFSQFAFINFRSFTSHFIKVYLYHFPIIFVRSSRIYSDYTRLIKSIFSRLKASDYITFIVKFLSFAKSNRICLDYTRLIENVFQE